MAIELAASKILESAVKVIIATIGDNPDREGLKETPGRVARAYGELFAGYAADVPSLFKSFTEGACDEMVMLRDIEFYSTCEHHMLPFMGKVSIGYIPAGRVVGVSKLARLVEVFSRRLQIQENMTAEIADAIVKHLKPKGVMVVCQAQHLCMTARGVKKQNSTMVTSAVRGVFKKDLNARQEFLGLCR
jgi:GTP cyclohydrolase I